MQKNEIKIWENLQYDGAGTDGFEPTLTTYLLEGASPRATVLICPGGGYKHVSFREGEPVALQFNAIGFHAFVLNYSVDPRKHPQPLMDLARALCLIRENASIWQVDPGKIAVCGFSAGGHLAASLATYGKRLVNRPGINTDLIRPDALILGYPVITAGEYTHQNSFKNLLGEDSQNPLRDELSLERQVNSQTPPVFIWHTYEDKVVPVENTLLFAQALRAEKIPFEMHIFGYGPHALSLATAATSEKNHEADPHVAHWMDLCFEWLKQTWEIVTVPG